MAVKDMCRQHATTQADPNERASLGSEEEPEKELEDEGGEIKTAVLPDAPVAKPAWIPHQWYTRPNR